MSFRTTNVYQAARTYFDVRLTEGGGAYPALGQIGQPEYNVNGGAWINTGLTPLVEEGFGRYYSDINAGVFTTVGDIIQTRYKGILTLESAGDTFQVIDSTITNTIPTLAYGSTATYVEVANAEVYFANRPNSRRWVNSNINDKRNSLREATRIIDTLSYIGEKAYSGQFLQFPRGLDTVAPKDIEMACCEIAFEILDGNSPNRNVENVAIISHSYGNTKTMYDRSFVMDHVRAGIPSAKAWAYLYPYLRKPSSVKLTRL